MIVSFRLLQNFLPELKESAEQISDILTQIGFEVTKITQYPPVCKGPCVVGKVLKVQPHPNATKLQIVTVGIDKDCNSLLQIVCGASNVRNDIFVPVALPGCVLPGGLEIKSAEIRGVASAGMICSLSELGLQTQKEDGIWIIQEDVQEGQSVAKLLDLQDCIFDVDILSNRADCMSVWGLAREISIACKVFMVENWGDFPPGSPGGKTNWDVEVQEKICDAFYLDKGPNVQVVASTQRVQQILQRHEVVPHNSILDTVSLAMILYGHPMHVYDADKIGCKFKIAQGLQGVDFSGLNEKTYPLSLEDIVISDEKGAICLAGILGGQNSCVTEETKNICLESALFSAACIRKTGRQKGIFTKAAFLFERGTTFKQLELGRDFVQKTLSKELGIVWQNCFAKPFEENKKASTIVMDSEKVCGILGYKVDWQECVRIWQGIGCEVLQGKESLISPPSWRTVDLKEPCDLVEEVLRHTGYNGDEREYPVIVNSVSVQKSGFRSEKVDFCKKFYQVGMGMGYKQVFTSPLTHQTHLDHQISIDNPMLSHQTHLRESFFAGMISCVQYNVGRGRSPIALMEMDYVFYKQQELIKKQNLLGLCYLTRVEKSWWHPEIVRGISDFSSHILTLLEKCCGLQTKDLQIHKQTPPALCQKWDKDLYYTACLYDKKVASYGVVAAENLSDSCKNLSERILFYGEMDIDFLYTKRQNLANFVSPYPCLYRDFAVIILKNYWMWPVQNYIQNFHPWIRSAEVVNVYEGDEVGKENISVVFSISYQDTEKTLTKKDVECVENDLAKKIVTQFAVQLR